MNYTLNQLNIFLKIAQTESITKASEELYLTQPAVSIQLKNFQDQFDIPLTENIGRKIYLTDFGREIATAAEKILNEVYAINYKTLAHKGQLTGRLKISVVSTGKYVMPYFLSGYLTQHPGIELLMDVTNKLKVIADLENNLVDFALVSVLPAHLNIETVPLMPNRLFMIGNQAQTFDTQPYEKTFFGELSLIYREKGSGTRFVMEKFFEENHIKVRKKLELTSNEAVKQAVIAGLGFSIMPLIGIKNELSNHDLQIIPLKGLPLSSHWHLVWLKSKSFSPCAEAYLRYLKNEKDNIIQQYFSWISTYK